MTDVDGLVKALKQHPEKVLRISGHTDASGSEGYNQRLSLFRANMIKSFFLGKGLAPRQLKVTAFGSDRPVASNDTARGRSLNRRVELDIE
ncbi:MAG: OmpA family protein [Desulfopila sp.]